MANISVDKLSVDEILNDANRIKSIVTEAVEDGIQQAVRAVKSKGAGCCRGRNPRHTPCNQEESASGRGHLPCRRRRPGQPHHSHNCASRLKTRSGLNPSHHPVRGALSPSLFRDRGKLLPAR